MTVSTWLACPRAIAGMTKENDASARNSRRFIGRLPASD
jgi:hypothetical protein